MLDDVSYPDMHLFAEFSPISILPGSTDGTSDIIRDSADLAVARAGRV